VGESAGAAAGLVELAELERDLSGYHGFHLARGEMLRRIGDEPGAQAELEAALALTTNDPERRLIEARMQ
jgi:RNA polymerase sigma-70 factor (ECF subfamily)